MIKAHKRHLASDRTSCSKAAANQFRLVLHTAAYWLLHTLRGLAPKVSFWCEAQFDTIRQSAQTGQELVHVQLTVADPKWNTYSARS